MLKIKLRDTIALQDSNIMLTLTHKTIHEGKSMKAITIVALVYLPASFTAVSKRPETFRNTQKRKLTVLDSSQHGLHARRIFRGNHETRHQS